MYCPYCVSEIPDAATVCSSCQRDLYLVKQLSERVAQLEAELAQRAPTGAEEVVSVSEAVDESGSGGDLVEVPGRAWGKGLAALLLPLLILLAAHWLIIFVYDSKVLYLRLLALLVPLPFGFMFARAMQFRFVWSLLPGCLMAVAAVYGMSAVTGYLDGVPVLPQTAVEVREFFEFAASISFSFVTGLWVREWLRQREARRVADQAELRRRLGPLATVSGLQVADSLSRLNDIGGAVIGVATSAISIYTGLKGFFGG
jgi:hypothetical protein